MKSLLVLCCIVAVTFAAKAPEWESFKAKFNRKYESLTEESFRKKIFLNNVQIIQKHNALHAEGKTTFTLGINQFADLTTFEYKSMVNGFKGTVNKATTNYVPSVNAAPASRDWRTDSACVTPIKDQGQCGSCWAFSSTGSTEFYTCYTLNKAVVSLSEQNLMDCTFSYGNLACDGGWMNDSFKYIIANKGIDTEASYPYEEQTNINDCRYNAANSGASLSSYVELPYGDETSLLNSIGNTGVVSVAIDASHNSFQLYTSGIYYEPLCSTSNLDHAVLAVGYGSTGETNGDYYIVKNSWGVSWGEAGYIQMSRNRNNNCGIASAASYPVV